MSKRPDISLIIVCRARPCRGLLCQLLTTLFHIYSVYLNLFLLHSLTRSIKGRPIKIIGSASLVPMCWGSSFLNQKAISVHEEFEIYTK